MTISITGTTQQPNVTVDMGTFTGSVGSIDIIFNGIPRWNISSNGSVEKIAVPEDPGNIAGAATSGQPVQPNDPPQGNTVEPHVEQEESASSGETKKVLVPVMPVGQQKVVTESVNNADFVHQVFGSNMDVTGVRKTYDEGSTLKSETWIFHSNQTTCTCPLCGRLAFHKKKCGTQQRTVQDVPRIPGVSLYYEFHGREYQCINHKCPNSSRAFVEPIRLAPPYARRTVFLNTLIICLCLLSIGLSGLETVLNALGVEITDQTISNMIRRIPVYDNKDVVEIGVDDISNRKGQSYLTVIYDRVTGIPLAILKGRDGTELRKWLLEHPKVQLVCRDRASAYAKVIDEVFAGKELVQVADRFHLFENVFDHLKNVITSQMPDKIAIKDGKILGHVPSKAVHAHTPCTAEELDALSYDNSPVLDENGNPVIVDSRLTNPDSKAAIKAAENRKREVLLARQVKQEYMAICAMDAPREVYRKLKEKFSISEYMVKKYSSLSDEEIEALEQPRIYKHRANGMDDYANIAYKMLNDGLELPLIIQYIRHKGCTLADLTLINHLLSICAHHFPNMAVPSLSELSESHIPDGVIIISRNEVLKYLVTTDSNKLNPLVAKYIDVIKKKYPVCETVRTIYSDFHETVMGKDPNRLDTFINKYGEMEYLKGFCKSLKHDEKAIKYAIVRSENSGFVEGSNHKVKLYKRAMYGRSSLDNLFSRCQLAFFLTSPLFSLADLNADIKWQEKLYSNVEAA